MDQETAALTRRAKAILSYPAAPPPLAPRLLQLAAARGDGEAAYLLAVLTGSGLGVVRDVELASRLLQRSVQLGFADADELALVERTRSAWDREPNRTAVSERPKIRLSSGLVPVEACRWLIERSGSGLVPARVFDPSGTYTVSARRTSTTRFFKLLDLSVVMALVRGRISQACGAPVSHLEDVSLLHYEVGQTFAAHLDIVPDAPAYAENIRRYGKRLATFLIYLNGGFEGGETDFPEIGYRYKGGPGDAIYWVNLDSEGKPDLLTRHAGLAPTEGEKWLLSQWIRTRAPLPPGPASAGGPVGEPD